jgi:hypothetical protein
VISQLKPGEIPVLLPAVQLPAGVQWRRISQRHAGRPKEQATHMYVFDKSVVSFNLRDESLKAFAFVGTEDELEENLWEVADTFAGKASIEEVKATVHF